MVSSEIQKGKLFLIPSNLAETEYDSVFPRYNLKVINTLSVFIVENIRTARRFLRGVGYRIDFDQVTFYILNKHTDVIELSSFLDEAVKGRDIGLMSEAGTPCIADPGGAVVRLAHQKMITVKALTGPNSIMLALMASGFNGQSFTFHGYLPIDEKHLKNKIRALEKDVLQKNQTQIFIETPFRNEKLVKILLSVLSENMSLCLATNITDEAESVQTLTIKEWKKNSISIRKKPTVFLIFK